MNTTKSTHLAAGAWCIAAVVLLSACTSPVVYRPEVEGFQRATAEMSGYVEAKRTSIADIRRTLRREELTALAATDERPEFTLPRTCAAALQGPMAPAGDGASAPALDPSSCELVVRSEACDSDASGEACKRLALVKMLVNPGQVLDDSAAFAEAVSVYATALDKVATAGDRESFIKAVDGLANSATSVATAAAKAAGNEPPDLTALTPIASVVGLAASYYLENRRTEALARGARAAHRWIEKGAAAVARTLTSAQFEIVRVRRAEVLDRIDDANEARPAQFVAAADSVIAANAALRRVLASDPGAPFRALPAAHATLIDAFDDRSRHLSEAIAASKALLQAAMAARDALTKD